MSEKEIEHIHRPFMAWMNERGLLYVNARSDKPSTIAKGHPDFLITHAGRCLYIEVKAPQGKLSDDQVRYIERIRSSKSPIVVCRSLDECVAAVQTWLGEGYNVVTKTKSEPDSDLRIMTWGRNGSTKSVVQPDGYGGWSVVRSATPDDLLHLKSI